MSRRGQNEGTISKRADGRWMARLHLGYDTAGRRQRQTFYGTTRKEVQEKLVAARHAQQQGLPVRTDRQTVAQFLVQWVEESARPAVRPRTYASYRQVLRLYLLPALGRYPLSKLAPEHVQALLNRLVAQGLSPRTAQYTQAVLRKALNQAVKWGKVPRNVATLIDPPRVERHDIQVLNACEARRLLDAAAGDRLEALYAVAVALGLRQSEILGLRWCDVDLDRGTLTVSKQLQRLDGRWQLVEPKTRQSRRTITLPQVTLTQLRAHRARQGQERLAAGLRWQHWDLVFPSSIGTPLEPRNLVTRFKALLQRAGLPDLRFHDLRHSCASLLIAQGVSPRVVMETLGHSQIGLTMNTYAHVLPEVQRQAATAMDALFSDIPGTAETA
jgi:integrase